MESAASTPLHPAPEAGLFCVHPHHIKNPGPEKVNVCVRIEQGDGQSQSQEIGSNSLQHLTQTVRSSFMIRRKLQNGVQKLKYVITVISMIMLMMIRARLSTINRKNILNNTRNETQYTDRLHFLQRMLSNIRE